MISNDSAFNEKRQTHIASKNKAKGGQQLAYMLYLLVED